MTEDEFEQVILRALEQLPAEFVSALDNLNIEIRPRPSPYELEESCLGPGDTLFGLYVGVPLPDRTHFDTMSLPDQILIFQEPHEQAFGREEEMVEQIRRTLLHEIGHYLGMDEDRLADLDLD